MPKTNFGQFVTVSLDSPPVNGKLTFEYLKNISDNYQRSTGQKVAHTFPGNDESCPISPLKQHTYKKGGGLAIPYETNQVITDTNNPPIWVTPLPSTFRHTEGIENQRELLQHYIAGLYFQVGLGYGICVPVRSIDWADGGSGSEKNKATQAFSHPVKPDIGLPYVLGPNQEYAFGANIDRDFCPNFGSYLEAELNQLNAYMQLLVNAPDETAQEKIIKKLEATNPEYAKALTLGMANRNSPVEQHWYDAHVAPPVAKAIKQIEVPAPKKLKVETVEAVESEKGQMEVVAENPQKMQDTTDSQDFLSQTDYSEEDNTDDEDNMDYEELLSQRMMELLAANSSKVSQTVEQIQLLENQMNQLIYQFNIPSDHELVVNIQTTIQTLKLQTIEPAISLLRFSLGVDKDQATQIKTELEKTYDKTGEAALKLKATGGQIEEVKVEARGTTKVGAQAGHITPIALVKHSIEDFIADLKNNFIPAGEYDQETMISAAIKIVLSRMEDLLNGMDEKEAQKAINLFYDFFKADPHRLYGENSLSSIQDVAGRILSVYSKLNWVSLPDEGNVSKLGSGEGGAVAKLLKKLIQENNKVFVDPNADIDVAAVVDKCYEMFDYKSFRHDTSGRNSKDEIFGTVLASTYNPKSPTKNDIALKRIPNKFQAEYLAFRQRIDITYQVLLACYKNNKFDDVSIQDNIDDILKTIKNPVLSADILNKAKTYIKQDNTHTKPPTKLEDLLSALDYKNKAYTLGDPLAGMPSSLASHWRFEDEIGKPEYKEKYLTAITRHINVFFALYPSLREKYQDSIIKQFVAKIAADYGLDEKQQTDLLVDVVDRLRKFYLDYEDFNLTDENLKRQLTDDIADLIEDVSDHYASYLEKHGLLQFADDAYFIVTDADQRMDLGQSIEDVVEEESAQAIAKQKEIKEIQLKNINHLNAFAKRLNLPATVNIGNVYAAVTEQYHEYMQELTANLGQEPRNLEKEAAYLLAELRKLVPERTIYSRASKTKSTYALAMPRAVDEETITELRESLCKEKLKSLFKAEIAEQINTTLSEDLITAKKALEAMQDAFDPKANGVLNKRIKPEFIGMLKLPLANADVEEAEKDWTAVREVEQEQHEHTEQTAEGSSVKKRKLTEQADETEKQDEGEQVTTSTSMHEEVLGKNPSFHK